MANLRSPNPEDSLPIEDENPTTPSSEHSQISHDLVTEFRSDALGAIGEPEVTNEERQLISNAIFPSMQVTQRIRS